MATNSETFGQVLRRLRRERRWTQEDLAEEAVIDQASVSQYERGKHKPSMEMIRRLAGAFGMPAEELARLAGHLPEAAQQEAAEADLDAAAVRQLLAIPGVRRMIREARESEGEPGVRELLEKTARILGIVGDHGPRREG